MIGVRGRYGHRQRSYDGNEDEGDAKDWCESQSTETTQTENKGNKGKLGS